MSAKGVAVLGCTGSIGRSALDVLERCGDQFEVRALAAGSDVKSMLPLCRKWRPALACMFDPDAAARLRLYFPKIGISSGEGGVSTLAASPECEVVVHGIPGAAGLRPAMAALNAGKRLLLANKESLVMAGPLMMAAARRHGARILPLDSEHNAALQCLPPDQDLKDVESLTLTASGGGLRDVPVYKLPKVTPEQACTHPNWSMGAKITVDSATMMNKGLEVMEACHLFALPPERVKALVHPQSIVHAMIQYRDGSVLAHMAWPDMRAPIAYALGWPQGRYDSGVGPLDLAQVASLEFAEPDYRRYPCLRLAQEAAAAGGSAPIVLNAANEVAVRAFLSGGIAFTRIAKVVSATMDRVQLPAADDMDSVLAVDAEARRVASARL